MTIANYEKEILNCSGAKCESVLQRVADSFEDDLLEVDSFPEDYFTFFLRLLSEEQFFNKPGVWNFLLVMGTESHKLSTDHYNKIADCILNNFAHYQDEDLNLAVCDFIARNYDHKLAEKILLTLKEIEKEKKEKGFADDGLRILSNEKKRDESNS
jgi:hypothetical protein